MIELETAFYTETLDSMVAKIFSVPSLFIMQLSGENKTKSDIWLDSFHDTRPSSIRSAFHVILVDVRSATKSPILTGETFASLIANTIFSRSDAYSKISGPSIVERSLQAERCDNQKRSCCIVRWLAAPQKRFFFSLLCQVIGFLCSIYFWRLRVVMMDAWHTAKNQKHS